MLVMRLLLVLCWGFLLAVILLAPGLLKSAEPGDALIRNTVRLALLFYGLALSLMLLRGPDRLARTAWVLAWAAFVIHVGMAFEHQHGWSHARAFEHTRQVSGVGEGLYVSYLFTLLWTGDVLWWLMSPCSRARRPAWMGVTLHGFMLFMVFNATVVFETGFIRWAGAGLFAVLACLWFGRGACPMRPERATTEKRSAAGTEP